jgi:hypothetical protein
MSVCLSVRYAFSPCNSYRHQTFHNTSLGPEEGRHGVGITKKGQEGVPEWNFTHVIFLLLNVTKLSTILPQVQRKIERRLTRPLGVGEGGLGEISPSLVYCYLDWFSRDLRKSLTICTEFSYFYFFSYVGLRHLEVRMTKNEDMHTHTKPSV